MNEQNNAQKRAIIKKSLEYIKAFCIAVRGFGAAAFQADRAFQEFAEAVEKHQKRG